MKLTKAKIIIIFLITLIFTSCFEETDEITGHAIIVDNFKDKTPLKGLYIEVEHTEDGGYNYDVLVTDTTDENGYFDIDIKFKTAFFNLDAYSYAHVYSDTEYSDTLGFFTFQFPDHTYRYKTIHIDTLCLEHNIWVVPRIRSLGTYQADEISIHYYNCTLVDPSTRYMTFPGPVYENQEFEPVEVTMTMNIQHWLTYGSRDFARGSLKIDSQEIGFGYFKVEEYKHTNEGDTLYLNFDVQEDQ